MTVVATGPGTKHCADLVAFADGELEPEQAAAFRVHLDSCEVCQAGLVEHVQLIARLSTLTTQNDTKETT